MRTLMKIMVILLLISVVAVVAWFYAKCFVKKEGLPFLRVCNISQENISSDTEQAPFESDTPLVKDPDLGAVYGTAEMTPVAYDFYMRFHLPSSAPEPLDKMYRRFKVLSVDGAGVTVRTHDTQEIKNIRLVCDLSETALFKNVNIEFVSAGFDIKQEITAGDMLFAPCVDESCVSVGPKCIILRNP